MVYFCDSLSVKTGFVQMGVKIWIRSIQEVQGFQVDGDGRKRNAILQRISAILSMVCQSAQILKDLNKVPGQCGKTSVMQVHITGQHVL